VFSDRTRCFPALLALVALLTPGCSRGPERPFEIVSILPFEDLSPSGQGALGRGLANLTVERSAGDRKIRVVQTANLRDAQLLRSTRVLSGWYEVREGKVMLHATLRDEAAGRALKNIDLTATESEFPSLADSLAAATGAPVHNYPLPKAEAVIALERGLPEDALKIDPGYGAAHLARVEQLLRAGDAAGLPAAVEAGRSARLTEADRARLDMTAARLKNSLPEQLAALKKLTATQTANIDLLRALLELQFLQRDYKPALETARQILELSPSDEDTLNKQGYLYTFSGDLPGARRAFEDYRKKRPDSANAVDSMAEALFYFRRYDEAAGLFLEAHKKNSNILNGGEPFRAALSYALAGNLKEADAEMAKLFQSRKGDPSMPWRQAVWKRMTGRKSDMPPTAAGLAADSLYALRDGDRARAAALAAEARKQVKNPAEVTLAAMASLLSQPSAPVAVWQSRIATAASSPSQAQLRTELLGWALILDRHYAEAAAVWKPMVEKTSPFSNNESRMVHFWALAEAGQKDEARKAMPEGWLPPSGLDPGLGMLFYPTVPELRTKL
jgi:tetratricopeptide (TPR) repeat protein